ncbi:MAG: hypothetical protein LBN93_05905 [Candidatus Symbiothrix sp.]|jgi:hypothetical protein|nr:hypothetical protein [Candidatus Symbiothrix sp.]
MKVFAYLDKRRKKFSDRISLAGAVRQVAGHISSSISSIQTVSPVSSCMSMRMRMCCC